MASRSSWSTAGWAPFPEIAIEDVRGAGRRLCSDKADRSGAGSPRSKFVDICGPHVDGALHVTGQKTRRRLLPARRAAPTFVSKFDQFIVLAVARSKANEAPSHPLTAAGTREPSRQYG